LSGLHCSSINPTQCKQPNQVQAIQRKRWSLTCKNSAQMSAQSHHHDCMTEDGIHSVRCDSQLAINIADSVFTVLPTTQISRKYVFGSKHKA
jgi:hypothetical protein